MKMRWLLVGLISVASAQVYYNKGTIPPASLTSALSGHYYTTDGGWVLNMTDRVMIGSAAQANGKGPGTYSGYPSWLGVNNYLFRDTQLGAISNYGLWGITAASRASDYTGGLSQALGAYGGLINNDSGIRVGRVQYLEADMSNTTASISNLIGEYALYDTSGNDYTLTPYGGSGFGSAGIRFGCGESAIVAAATTNCNYAISVFGKLNGSTVTFNKGIVFERDSLTGTTGASGGGNAAQAIEMGYGQGIRWWSANGSVAGGRISSLATASSDQSIDMQFLNNGVQWANNSSTNTLKITHVASGQNGVLITDAVNGSGPTISPISGDSEIVLPLNLSGLGGGGVASADAVSFTGGLTVNSLAWPNTIVGAGVFNGASGIKIPNSPTNIHDTTSSGTITSTYSNRLASDTYLSTSATTLTNVYTLDIEAPIQGTNVTIGTGGSLRLGGSMIANGVADFEAGAFVANAANFYWSSRGIFSSPASGTIQHGDADSATPVNQTIKTQGSRGGTDTDTAGANLIIQSGLGTGSATGSTLTLKTPNPGSTGTTAETAVNGLLLGSTQISLGNATSNPAFSFLGSGTVAHAGLITGAAGATVSGAAISLNASSNFNTSINTGTSTGTVTIGQNAASPSAIVLAGPVSLQAGTAFSGASWTTTSPVFNGVAMTLNDTTASGTVTTEAAYTLQAPTFTSTGAGSTTITNPTTLWIAAPVCSGGVVCTNTTSIFATGKVNFQSGITVTGNTINLNASSNAAVNICTGTCNNTVTLGGASTTLITSPAPFTMSNATVKMTGITTGTNADTVCLSSTGVVLIQAAACTISSLRFKEAVAPFNGDALGLIKGLEVSIFRMKKDARPNRDKNAYSTQIGLIAENIAKIEPRCAIYEPDMKTPKSYRQECVIALLVAGEQELLKQNRELKARLTKLETH